MKFLHPIFMIILLGFLYKIFNSGKTALSINEKSPEADKREELIKEHGTTAKLITALMFVGFIGGVFGMIYFIGVREIFIKSYGHGFIGAGILGLMLSNLFVGKSIKKPPRPSQQANLLSFHKGISYFIVIGSVFSLVTGIIILVSGPST